MEHENLKIIGQRIREVRNELGLSQKALAEKFGMSGSALSEIEAGNNSPTFSFLFKLAKHFKVSMDYLVYGKGKRFFGKKPEEGDENKYLEEIETIEDLIWFLEESLIFRHEIMTHASIYLLEHDETIKKNIERRRSKKKKVNKEKEKGAKRKMFSRVPEYFYH
jgi:transcriptional regulator with XRE-family HTH domain